ncbi:hypothetical protein [Thorsellia anophelis]|uniref:Uncharacterized protein n=1 Tax=Thorsellia anophelis DSM 18579 TaxID=1123402 RepID=A0A1I0FS84_9GAMM|nr:hypothetical protein [Thorsellia anophelis]SET60233.1 hypothetical protein SAMN02583745_02850 [Thorsellia anophelis DSM 18579]
MTTETIETNATVSNLETVEINEVDIVQALTVLPEQKTALDVFKNENNEAEIILSRVKDHFSSLVFDMNTAKGRAECRAQAALIRKIKAKMEEIGKAEAAELKLLPKKVDTTRNFFKDKFEELAIAVRAPLTAYEAEEERKKAEEKAKKEAEELKKEIERCHEEALQMNELFDLKREQERVKAEQDKKAAEEKLQREAEDKARAEAKYQADLKIQEAENDKLRAQQKAAETERKTQEAIDEANKKAQAEIARLKKEQEDAENARLAKEKAEKEAEDARKANEDHRRTINRAAVVSLEDQGLDYDTAVKILKAIVKGEVAHVTVNY